MELPRLVLHRRRERRLLAGHPWIYRNEVAEMQGEAAPGDLVAVVDAAGHWLGQGFYSPVSQICVRILSRRPEPIDEEFFRQRIATAIHRRLHFYPHERSVRLIFGEGDFLPGLIVDRYEDYLVCQFLTAGVDRRRDMWVKLLVEELSPHGILGRQDAPTREHEGLERGTEILYGSVPHRVKIRENGVPFWVDLQGGQKTGYFLDQKENRRQLQSLITPGMRVLDAFSHTGSFALHALAYGAGEVVAVEISPEAVALARENERLLRDEGLVPHAGSVRWETANAFDYLRQLVRQDEMFDLCILDPPAFTKGREAVQGAWRGYKEINLRAMKLLRPGGFLVTCSCSYHMNFALFLQVVQEAAVDNHRAVQVVEYRSQAKDHPYLLSVPETAYLKCLIAQVF